MMHDTVCSMHSRPPKWLALFCAIVIGCLMVPVTVLAQPGSNPGKPVVLNGSVGFGIDADLRANLKGAVADTSDVLNRPTPGRSFRVCSRIPISSLPAMSVISSEDSR